MRDFGGGLERTARVPREAFPPAAQCAVTDVLTAPVLRYRHFAEIRACAAPLAPSVVPVGTLAPVVPAASAMLTALAASALVHGRSPREPRVPLAVLVVARGRSAREPRAAAPQSPLLWLASLSWLVLPRCA